MRCSGNILWQNEHTKSPELEEVRGCCYKEDKFRKVLNSEIAIIIVIIQIVQ